MKSTNTNIMMTRIIDCNVDAIVDCVGLDATDDEVDDEVDDEADDDVATIIEVEGVATTTWLDGIGDAATFVDVGRAGGGELLTTIDGGFVVVGDGADAIEDDNVEEIDGGHDDPDVSHPFVKLPSQLFHPDLQFAMPQGVPQL